MKEGEVGLSSVLSVRCCCSADRQRVSEESGQSRSVSRRVVCRVPPLSVCSSPALARSSLPSPRSRHSTCMQDRRRTRVSEDSAPLSHCSLERARQTSARTGGQTNSTHTGARTHTRTRRTLHDDWRPIFARSRGESSMRQQRHWRCAIFSSVVRCLSGDVGFLSLRALPSPSIVLPAR